jgi:TonB family protein
MRNSDFDLHDPELREMLHTWTIDEAPASLDQKVLSFYRQTVKQTRREPLSLTILENRGVVERLLLEVGTLFNEFKNSPKQFTKAAFAYNSRRFLTFISSPRVAMASMASIFAITSVVMLVIMLDQRLSRQDRSEAIRDDIELLSQITDIPETQPTPDPGPAGTNKGKGGGSKPKFERPAGGGGGGRQEQAPASKGKLPQASLDIPQVLAPEVKPPPIKNPSLPVAATIKADPLLFPPDTRPIPYGDPKSKSTTPSAGPGTGGGIGSGTGAGVGPGTGGGVGPGTGGNTGGGDFRAGGGGPGGGGGGTYRASQVTQKARIISKPEPAYTEEARKNNITGTVVLRAVLASSGSVTNIVPVRGLPYGLTEKAIAAARQIRFEPARKDGHAVSQYIQIEYNFNMY